MLSRDISTLALLEKLIMSPQDSITSPATALAIEKEKTKQNPELIISAATMVFIAGIAVWVF